MPQSLPSWSVLNCPSVKWQNSEQETRRSVKFHSIQPTNTRLISSCYSSMKKKTMIKSIYWTFFHYYYIDFFFRYLSMKLKIQMIQDAFLWWKELLREFWKDVPLFWCMEKKFQWMTISENLSIMPTWNWEVWESVCWVCCLASFIFFNLSNLNILKQN